MNNFFDNRDTKIKKAPSCCARREGSENVPFDLERSISKNDLRSGQVKVRSLPKYVNMHIFRSVFTRNERFCNDSDSALHLVIVIRALHLLIIRMPLRAICN